jgi:hypothetical protein
MVKLDGTVWLTLAISSRDMDVKTSREFPFGSTSVPTRALAVIPFEDPWIPGVVALAVIEEGFNPLGHK